MKIIIAGRDRTEELGGELRRRALQMEAGDDEHRSARLPPVVGALSLAEARSEGEYVARLSQLLRHRDSVSTRNFHIPRRPGLAGWCKDCFRQTMWRLLRYQRDRMAFRQDLINTQLSSAQTYETMQRQKEIAALRRRLDKLEGVRVEDGGTP